MMCTLEQRGQVFVLTLTGEMEHWLGHPLIASIRSALATVAASAQTNGAALVTVAEERFFSNGLDIGWAGTSRARIGELVDIGLPLPPYFMALVRAKIAVAQALRDVMLRGKKIRAPEAKEMGFVDVVCPSAPETAAEALKLAARKWDGAVYASIRISMFSDACRSVGIVEESDEEKARNFASKL
ncbi:unnamed protein product [Alopecurus aequalis]